MRFSVCLVAPEDYKFSHFLYDTCKYFCFTIEAAGHDCCIVKNHLYGDRINILIGAHNLSNPGEVEHIKSTGEYIVVQSEVLTENSIAGWPAHKSYATVYQPLLRQATAVWDSLESNQIQLKKFGIDAELLPRVGYLSAMQEIAHKKNKDIDFLFYGSITPHRKKMLDELKARGGNIVCAFDDAHIFRNDLIARARVNVAPNQAPGIDHLSSRVLYLLNNRSVVVAERCYNQAWVEHCFLSADAAAFADLCMETIRRPDLDQLGDKYFEEYKKLDMVHLIHPLIEKLRINDKTCSRCEPSADQEHQKRTDSNGNMTQGVPSSSVPLEQGNSIQRPITPGLTSIIILQSNEVKPIKKCIESIIQHTSGPYEVVIVATGGNAGEITKKLKNSAGAIPSFKFIERSVITGFAQGVNAGVQECSGEYILVLDEHLVVSEEWLTGMLTCLHREPDAGIIGPLSNSGEGRQRVENADVTTIAHLDAFARKFRERNQGRRVRVDNIAGYCMLFRSELTGKVGLFDESLESDFFAVEDFCKRTRLSGLNNYIAGDVFVQWSRDSVIHGSRRLFDEKWRKMAALIPLGTQLHTLNALKQASDCFDKEQLDKAIAALMDGITQAPDDKAIYLYLAEVLISAKRFSDALDAIGSMANEAKNDLRILELIGYCKEGLGLDEEAREQADRVLELNPGSAAALNLKGILAYKKGDKVAAESLFTRAIEADPGYGEPCTNIGMLQWAADQRESALTYLERGFVLSPTTADIITAYHTAITTTGAFKRAEQVFRDAKALHPRNRRIAFMLIDLLIKQEDYIQAMREIEQAMILVGIDEGILAAALEVRGRIGPQDMKVTRKNEKSLSLAMIVKNEEQFLAKCLMSVKPIAHELIVVDTGSSDRTKDIATAFGAKVFDFPWTNDFSEARNHALSKASGDWIFVLDADEIIASRDYPFFDKILKNTVAPREAYSFNTRNYVNSTSLQGWTANDQNYSSESAGCGWIPSPKVRMFPRDASIRFENPVHELLEPSILKKGMKILACDVPIHHYGRLNQDKLMAKHDKYYALGKKKLLEKGSGVRAIEELAIQAAELQKHEEALELWQKVITTHPDHQLAYYNMGGILLMLKRYQEALVVSRKAVELTPLLKEAVTNYAMSELLVGELKNARAFLDKLLKNNGDYPIGLALFAAICFINGDTTSGKKHFEKIRTMKFNIVPFVNDIAARLMECGRIPYAEKVLDAAIAFGYRNDITIALRLECTHKSVAKPEKEHLDTVKSE